MYSQGQVPRRTWGGVCNVSKVCHGPLKEEGLHLSGKISTCAVWVGRAEKKGMGVVCAMLSMPLLSALGGGPTGTWKTLIQA